MIAQSLFEFLSKYFPAMSCKEKKLLNSITLHVASSHKNFNTFQTSSGRISLAKC